MARALWCAGFLVVAAWGCAGDGEGGGDRTTGRPGPGPGAPQGGAGGSASPSTPGGFGNPNQPAPRPIAGSGARAGSGGQGGNSGPCEVGKFCEPTSPDGNCGSLRIESDVEIIRQAGNILVIFDQSSSMDQPWSGGGSKLQAAQNALVQALTPLQESITAGAIFFPTAVCAGIALAPGAVEPIEGPQQIPFQPGPQFLQSWQTHWANRLPFGIGTPMNEAFDRADVAITGAKMNGKLTGQLAVIAFTDGEPNCIADPMVTMVPTMLEPARAADWLAKQQIKTYMVGLPGAAGVNLLDQVAMSGGTMNYILPDDPAQLEMVLKSIVSETVKTGFDSCAINLNPAAEVKDKLLMLVEENGVMGKQQVPRDRGWTLSDDGAHVEITGPLCEQAMGGRFTSITFEYACPDVPPPPALPPVE